MSTADIVFTFVIPGVFGIFFFVVAHWFAQKQAERRERALFAGFDRKDLSERIHHNYPVGTDVELISYEKVCIRSLHPDRQLVWFEAFGGTQEISLPFWQFEEEVIGVYSDEAPEDDDEIPEDGHKEVTT